MAASLAWTWSRSAVTEALRERRTALKGRLARHNGDASGGMSPRGTQHPPAAVPTFLMPECQIRPCQTLELGKQLRPDRDHPNEKHNRRQRGRFFYKVLQHICLPPRT